MALVKCVECGHAVSTGATACPGCGAVSFAPATPAAARAETKSQAVLIVGGIALALIIALLVFGKSDREREAEERAAVEAALSPQQRAAMAAEKAKKEQEFQFAALAVKALKATMKNPASFELVSAVLVDNGGPLCVEYRGTNSFNAVTTEHAVIKRDYKLGKWNADCAGKSVSNMMSIRHAL